MRSLRPRTQAARRLRRDSTEAEKQLWRALREQLPEFGFRRQHPIGPHIADFACPAGKLVIEIDGGQHALQQCQDAARTAELARRGYRVVRFWNNEVMEKSRRRAGRDPTGIGRLSGTLSALEGGEGGAREAGG